MNKQTKEQLRLSIYAYLLVTISDDITDKTDTEEALDICFNNAITEALELRLGRVEDLEKEKVKEFIFYRTIMLFNIRFKEHIGSECVSGFSSSYMTNPVLEYERLRKSIRRLKVI